MPMTTAKRMQPVANQDDLENRDLADRIRAGDAGWDKEVPPPVAIAIRSLKLWAD